MKITACTLIIKDDFDNILLLKKKAKRGEIAKWSLISEKVRGKDNGEKSLNKVCNKILKTIIFDLQEFRDYVIDEENAEVLKVFTGDLRGRFVLDKKYDEATWINKKDLINYDIDEQFKDILCDYVNSAK